MQKYCIFVPADTIFKNILHFCAIFHQVKIKCGSRYFVVAQYEIIK